MARCTALVRGHSSAAECPVRRYRTRRYSGYSSQPYSSIGGGNGYRSSTGGASSSSGSQRSRLSMPGSIVSYTYAQIVSLTPVREAVETRFPQQPDLRDVFLCHAWDERRKSAKELHDLLVAAGVKVWSCSCNPGFA